MVRGLALGASLLLAGALPALAQTHSGSHSRAHPHGPGHVRPDSTHHAAMHALLHGSWTGSFSSPHGLSSGMELSVAHDSLRNVMLRMSTDKPSRFGAASNLVAEGATFHWTQDLSGTACKASAVLTAATPLVPEVLEGKLACETGEITFTLRKKTG
jgi:hypothetical protein